ncbi:hypothetical protein J9303_14405 [Bacillaceae bacterium Marseille-Q3522]|nr:hypothetical protein [Bacillaceae bacterium Marseille-Q3522]
MSKIKKCTISTESLVAAIALMGYIHVAQKVADENKLSKKKTNDLINNPIHFEKDLSENIEAVISRIAASDRSVRLEKGTEYLIIHAYDKSEALLEYVHDNRHTFSNHSYSLGFQKTVSHFYSVDDEITEDPTKINIEFSEEMYNHIHAISPEELENEINDEQREPQIRRLLMDFKSNDQKMDQIFFEKYIGIRHNKQIETAQLFVTGEKNIWNLNYEQINEDKIIFTSVSFAQFFQVINLMITDFFSEAEPKKLKARKPGVKNHNKRFSFRRGFSFFWKSNLVLLLMILCFFINKSSWGYEGGLTVVLFAFLSETMLIILSFIGCLRPRIYK